MKVDFNAIVRTQEQILQEEKEAFMDRHMQKLLPPVVYRWIKEGKNLPMMARYLERRKIQQVVDAKGGLAIYQGSKRIAVFRSTIKPFPLPPPRQ